MRSAACAARCAWRARASVRASASSSASAVVGLALRFGITFLPRLAEATGLVTFGSWRLALLEGVAGQLAQLLTIPVVGLATVAFYVQLRVHAEGLDLVLAADRAFGRELSTMSPRTSTDVDGAAREHR